MQIAENHYVEIYKGMRRLTLGIDFKGKASTGTPKQAVGSRRRKSVTSTTPTEPEETGNVKTESVSDEEIVKVKKKKQEDDVDEEEEEYDWPPLVCCIGDALHEFVPTVRISERQMDPEIYSSWKGLQWSPPEFIRAPGSTSSNLAIALARLGGRVAFVGKVDDTFSYPIAILFFKGRESGFSVSGGA